MNVLLLIRTLESQSVMPPEAPPLGSSLGARARTGFRISLVLKTSLCGAVQ